MAKKKRDKKPKVTPFVTIKKLRTNYELKYEYDKRLSEYIKTFPKEHWKVKVDTFIGNDGSEQKDWIRVIRDVQIGKVVSFLKDNNYNFSFINLTTEEGKRIIREYNEKQKQIREAIAFKNNNFDVSGEDYSFLKMPPYDYQKKAIKFFEINDGVAILGDQPGVGKQAALDTLISTPKGWTKMGDLKVNDIIHDRFGGKSKVTGIFPQGKKDSYRIHFNDNTSTKCGLEHLWMVRDANRRQREKGWAVKTLKELIDSKFHYNLSEQRKKSGRKPILKWEIPVTQPVFYKKKNYFIDPYVLGALIGDGYTCGITLAISVPDFQSEIANKVKTLLPNGYVLNKRDYMSCPQYCIVKSKNNKKLANHVIREVRRLNLNVKSKSKFIPTEYLMGSVNQRKELLKGLMDTDGSCRKNRVNYHTTSKQLANDVVKLVQSLGGIAKINVYFREKEGKPTEYRVNVKTPFCPFYLKSKANAWNPKMDNYISKYISSVEYIGKEEQQCISVDSKDNTYLTDHFIVTHNTFSAFGYATKNNYKTLVICPAGLKLMWRDAILEFTNEKPYVFKYRPTKRSGMVNYSKEESMFHMLNYDSIKTYIKLEYKHKCNGFAIDYEKGGMKPCGAEWIDLEKSYKKCPFCDSQKTINSRIKGIKHFEDNDEIFLDPDDYDLIVIDEFHKMKEPKTEWTQQIKRGFKNIPRKLLLSGTAIKSKPIELYEALNFLDPDTWNNRHEFAKQYCAAFEDKFGWDYNGASNLEQLFERIASFYLRRLKKDVLSELPDKTFTEIVFEMTSAQQSKYNKLEKSTKKVINEFGEEEEIDKSFMEKTHELKMFTEDLKLKNIEEYIWDIIDAGEKVVLFFDYLETAKKVKAMFGDKVVIHTGEEKDSDNHEAVKSFQNDKSISVFGATILSAGVGLTLTAANKLIFIGQAWTSTDMEQAEDRIHRADTKHDNIQIITALMEGTVDIDIYDFLRGKAQIVSKVLDNEDHQKTSRRVNVSLLDVLKEKLLAA